MLLDTRVVERKLW